MYSLIISTIWRFIRSNSGREGSESNIKFAIQKSKFLNTFYLFFYCIWWFVNKENFNDEYIYCLLTIMKNYLRKIQKK